MNFNLAVGVAQKDSGIAAAKAARVQLVKLAREVAKATAAERELRLVTIDDVYRVLAMKGHDVSQLGNAAGSVFKESCWEFVGWRPSERVSNHARPVRIWKYAN